MKFAVDEIIDNIVVLENIETLERREVNISLLPHFIHEGSILSLENDCYVLDNNEELRRRQLIEERFKQFVEKTNFKILEVCITEDVRPDKTERWLNVILKKL